MLFNSLIFAVFLPVAFALYWLCGRHLRLQNLLVVTVSYVFYGWWDWRFLFLMALTSIWSYLFGVIESHGRQGSTASKVRLALSLIFNLGILCYFKYADFFINQANAVLSALGIGASLKSLNVVLPIGISFYTFQALGYAIDVYRRKVVPTKDPIAFLAFISFFPQLVAGPIERASNLLPQFLNRRTFDYNLAVDGCRQMLWGFFKKILVADSCAHAANAILGHAFHSSVSLWVGMVCFAFQIYGDFSGYSDIAIGCAKLFGIRLMRNFNAPYLSCNVVDFWRRWHISLTTWFRDYLYIPLGGGRCGVVKKLRNTFAVFLVSGFWHGASWTFVLWGAFHALCFLPFLLSGKKNASYANHAGGEVVSETISISMVPKIIGTFLVVVIGWTFFRAPDIATSFGWLREMLTFSDLSIRRRCMGEVSVAAIVSVSLLLIAEWFNAGKVYPQLPKSRVARWILYYAVFAMMVYMKKNPQPFIYFQF